MIVALVGTDYFHISHCRALSSACSPFISILPAPRPAANTMPPRRGTTQAFYAVRPFSPASGHDMHFPRWGQELSSTSVSVGDLPIACLPALIALIRRLSRRSFFMARYRSSGSLYLPIVTKNKRCLATGKLVLYILCFPKAANQQRDSQQWSIPCHPAEKRRPYREETRVIVTEELC